jgi:hypothetical protein
LELTNPGVQYMFTARWYFESSFPFNIQPVEAEATNRTCNIHKQSIKYDFHIPTIDKVWHLHQELINSNPCHVNSNEWRGWLKIGCTLAYCAHGIDNQMR